MTLPNDNILIAFNLSTSFTVTQSSEERVIKTMKDLLDVILLALGITDENVIILLYRYFSDLDYETIKDILTIETLDPLITQINNLFEADKKIKDITMELTGTYTTVILNKWNKLLEEFAKAQGFAFLVKIKQKDCKELLDSTKNAIDAKVKALNEMENIYHNISTESDTTSKYLKYKKKYLNLKKI